MASVVMPNLCEQGLVVGRGAEVLDPDAPAAVADDVPPGQRMPASTDTRAVTAGGEDGFPVGGVLLVEPLQRGADTTRALMPSPLSCSRVFTASCTSEPVAIRITSGLPFGASARTYAPRAALSADANVSPDASPFLVQIGNVERSGQFDAAVALDPRNDVVWRGGAVGTGAMLVEFEFFAMRGHGFHDAPRGVPAVVQRRSRKDRAERSRRNRDAMAGIAAGP